MLQDPPCIGPLLGCSDSDSSGGSSSSVSSSSLGASQSSSYSSSSSSTTFRPAASDTSTQIFSSSERTALYTVNVFNNGTQPQNSFAFTHGPVPSGAVFNPSRSSPECTQVGSSIQCVSTVLPKEIKQMTIVYTVNQAVSCSLSPVLHSVQEVTTVPANTIFTSVSCLMNGTSSSLSSSIPAVIYTDPYALQAKDTSGKDILTDKGTTTTTAGKGYKDIELGKGKGYKPYPKPRAGAVSDYFTARTSAFLVTPVSERPSEENSGLSLHGNILLVIAFIMLLSGIFLWRRIQKSRFF